MEPQWNDIDRRKLKNWRQTCPSDTLSITNPCAGLGMNPGLCNEMTNPMSHGMAISDLSVSGACLAG
jgi:hypothetical protein